MAHHAYFITGECEQGISEALAHAGNALGMRYENNPDLIVLRYALFSVDDARTLADLAHRAALNGTQKVIIISVLRLFHEAQNALLKLFEEPSAGTTLLLVIPSEGILLPTLRSRLLPLPASSGIGRQPQTVETHSFLKASAPEREKWVAKLLERAKSDRDEEKQTARNEAVRLAEALIEAGYKKRAGAKNPTEQENLTAFLSDLDVFLPILHERSAPLKLIFEHIILTIPEG